MHTFPERFEMSDLEADQIYYQQLTEAAAASFPVLHEAVVIQERRGLPTITPDGQYLVSTVPEVQGVIIMAGCQVGGIWASQVWDALRRILSLARRVYRRRRSRSIDLPTRMRTRPPYAPGVNRSMRVITGICINASCFASGTFYGWHETIAHPALCRGQGVCT